MIISLGCWGGAIGMAWTDDVNVKAKATAINLVILLSKLFPLRKTNLVQHNHQGFDLDQGGIRPLTEMRKFRQFRWRKTKALISIILHGALVNPALLNAFKLKESMEKKYEDVCRVTHRDFSVCWNGASEDTLLLPEPRPLPYLL